MRAASCSVILLIASAWRQSYWKDNIMAQAWNIKSREDLEKELKWLSEEGDRGKLRELAGWTPPALPDKPATEPSKFLAYDLVRYISRVRAGYAAGYFTEAEAWERIMPVAVRLQRAYKSWEEMGADRLEGRVVGGEKDPGFEMVYKLLINHTDPNSPWNINAWNTPLEKP
ncbi:MAG TPA: DUF1266 domain-containing protein, partial [Chthoniobacteraceae bacterium]|nr:DUF1266 domain-containing protein [Chthoniobacteraceae bacterium]